MLDKLAEQAESLGIDALLELERLERTLSSAAGRCRTTFKAIGTMIYGSEKAARQKVNAARGRKKK